MTTLAVLLLTLGVAPAPPAGDATWSAMARNDLQAMHDLLSDNHPGPVDPENSRYREWLEAGLQEAAGQAQAARSYGDYVRALRFYTNDLQDGHIGIGLEISLEETDWPGFIVGPSADGAAVVTRAEADSGVKVGDRVMGCDGRTIDELMRERVDPYRRPHRTIGLVSVLVGRAGP